MQLRQLRPDLVLVDIRGNVDSRLRKLDEQQVDALVLAAAGIKRLGLESRVSEYFTVERIVPDAGQGILAVEARRGAVAAAAASALDDETARCCGIAERSVVRALGADCRSPVGAHAQVLNRRLSLSAVASGDGESPAFAARSEGAQEAAESLGKQLGRSLKASIG